MKLHKTRRTAAVLAASATLAVGIGVTGGATAGAQTDRFAGPELSVEQGAFDGGNVKLTLTNPNIAEVPSPLFTLCTSALLDGAQAIQAYAAYNAGDYATLLQLVGSGTTLGPSVLSTVVNPGPNTSDRTVDVADGVYVYLGACGAGQSLTDPSTIGVSFQPLIVPDGVGSVASVFDFGSTVLQSGVGSADLLPLLGALTG